MQSQQEFFLTSIQRVASDQPLSAEQHKRRLKKGRPNRRITQAELSEILSGLTSPNIEARKAVYEKYPLWMRRTAVNIANLDYGKEGVVYRKASCPIHKKQNLTFRYSKAEGIRVYCGLCKWTTHYENFLWHSESGMELCGLSKRESFE
jgi:hypothetical protein